MNIEEAKCIPMSKILDALGIQPTRKTIKDSMYLSPLRNEKTPSFHVTHNLWFDHGDNIGGNTVDFVKRHLKRNKEDATEVDALRWINNMTGAAPLAFVVPYEVPTANQENSLIKKKVKPITHGGLINYLHKRGIDINVAKNILKEIHVLNKNTNKSFAALGLKNEDNGYELRNPGFKGSLGPKSISFIHGKIPKPDTIHLFEGKMDFLTLLTVKKQVEPYNDVIVLNSINNLPQAVAYIKNYGYRIAYTWFDNDAAGNKATNAFAEFVKTEENLVHKKKNALYHPHKDYNAWHMNNHNLHL